MAIGLLGALLPDISCSVRICGDWRGGGADAEPPVGPMFGGGEGGTSPATALTVWEHTEKERVESVNEQSSGILAEQAGRKGNTCHIYKKKIGILYRVIQTITCLVA